VLGVDGSVEAYLRSLCTERGWQNSAQAQPTPKPTPEIIIGMPSEDRDQSKSEIPEESKF
jgi:hypothetical protein